MLLAFVIFLGLIVVGLTVMLILWLWSLAVTKAPFVPIPEAVLPNIVETLKLNNSAVLIDLGSGDGRVLFAASKCFPNLRCVGIDKALFAIWSARFVRRGKFPNVSFVRKNFFKYPLNEATHVFTYLFPKLMNELLPKLEQELKPGTRLVSCDFQFSNKQPIQTIELNRPEHALGRTLYVYEF